MDYESFGKQNNAKQNRRHLQVAQVFKKILAEYLQDTDLINRENNVISIVDVRVNPSLSFVDVNITSIFNTEEIVKTLNSHKQEVRRYCASNIRHLRYIPDIRFHLDKTVETLLRFVKQDESEE